MVDIANNAVFYCSYICNKTLILEVNDIINFEQF